MHDKTHGDLGGKHSLLFSLLGIEIFPLLFRCDPGFITLISLGTLPSHSPVFVLANNSSHCTHHDNPVICDISHIIFNCPSKLSPQRAKLLSLLNSSNLLQYPRYTLNPAKKYYKPHIIFL